MNIGFYGHSNCAYRHPDSFIDIVATRLNANIVNTGVKQGSEERILFELKKTHNLDLAIIFHCLPRFLFLPECDRDIDTNSFKAGRAEDIFRNDHLDTEFTATNQPIFKKVFGNNENFFNAINTYRQYFYDPDLALNRYYGALIQIDQYLTFKNISAIHILPKKNSVPSWFAFTSGDVDYSIMDIFDQYPAKNPFFANLTTLEGNKLVAEKILNSVAARDRVAKRARP